MSIIGEVQNGVIIVPQPLPFVNGTRVRIESVSSAEPAHPASESNSEEKPVEGARRTLYERFEKYIGMANDLPPDSAQQHDHYLYGAPKS